MTGVIVQDSNGLWFQHLPPQEASYIDRRGNEGVSRLGGWYDLTCHPVDPNLVRHPVRVFYRQKGLPATVTPAAEARA